MTRLVMGLGAVMLGAMMLSSPAHAVLRSSNLLDSVNWARLQGCRSQTVPAPLRRNSQLDAAATRLAAGQTLHDAIAATGYLATQSSALHLTGDFGGSEVGRVLSDHYCHALADLNLSELGAARQGRDIWLVFAAPAVVPTSRDAPVVSRQILELVNVARATSHRCGNRLYSAAPPLVLNAALNRAAISHSESMARTGEFEHRGHDGSTPSLRVTRAGYGSFSVVGENIAAGAMTPAEVTQGWLDSPPHCENLMDPRFTDVGIGFAVNTKRNERVYWTQDLAAPKGHGGGA